MARGKKIARALRVLTASASQIDMEDKSEARRLRAVRQGWQADAWNYRDSITELRYAIQFKANALSRMGLYVAIEPEGTRAQRADPARRVRRRASRTVQGARHPGAARSCSRPNSAARDLLKNLSTNVDVAGELPHPRPDRPHRRPRKNGRSARSDEIGSSKDDGVRAPADPRRTARRDPVGEARPRS